MVEDYIPFREATPYILQRILDDLENLFGSQLADLLCWVNLADDYVIAVPRTWLLA